MVSLLECSNFYVGILEEVCNSCNFVILQEVFLEPTAWMGFSIKILNQLAKYSFNFSIPINFSNTVPLYLSYNHSTGAQTHRCTP